MRFFATLLRRLVASRLQSARCGSLLAFFFMAVVPAPYVAQCCAILSPFETTEEEAEKTHCEENTFHVSRVSFGSRPRDRQVDPARLPVASSSLSRSRAFLPRSSHPSAFSSGAGISLRC